MAFPSFAGRKDESAQDFMDNLETAFLVSGRNNEEIKLRGVAWVLREEARRWYQVLPDKDKVTWEVFKRAFLAKFGSQESMEELWRELSSLHQQHLRDYERYESTFIVLWDRWSRTLPRGQQAPEFLKKDKFIGGLFPMLQEKVRGKFPNTFEEALMFAREKDRKLRFQSQNAEGRHPL